MNILIRADSSSTIGLGHIMRDLVFAAQYSDDTVQFACQNLSGNIIDQIPHPVHILNSNDPDELIALIITQKIDLVVFDHYGIDEAYEKKVKEESGVTIFSFDDTYERHFCDILLNHNISADEKRYVGLVPEHCEIRCGKHYTLIRDEFRIEKQSKREKIHDIFIAMGGSDPTNATLYVLQTLKGSYRICVVTTSSNPHLEELKTFVSESKRTVLYVDSSNVARHMNESSLAIVTPSVMVHETLFMEIPFIALQTASNQDDIAEYLSTNGFRVMKHFNAAELNAHIKEVLS